MEPQVMSSAMLHKMMRDSSPFGGLEEAEMLLNFVFTGATVIACSSQKYFLVIYLLQRYFLDQSLADSMIQAFWVILCLQIEVAGRFFVLGLTLAMTTLLTHRGDLVLWSLLWIFLRSRWSCKHRKSLATIGALMLSIRMLNIISPESPYITPLIKATTLPWEESISTEPIYTPAQGMLWYLHSLIGSDFRTYFTILPNTLALVLPLITAGIVDEPSLAVPLCLLVHQCFLTEPSLPQVLMLLSFLITQNSHIIREMRAPHLLLSLGAVFISLSPVMKHMWIVQGAGNANYLFFQGLGMWTCLALFIVDFLGAYVSTHTTPKPILKEPLPLSSTDKAFSKKHD